MLDDSQNLLNVGVEQRGARKKNALFSYKPFSMNAEISVLLEEGYAPNTGVFAAHLFGHTSGSSYEERGKNSTIWLQAFLEEH